MEENCYNICTPYQKFIQIIDTNIAPHNSLHEIFVSMAFQTKKQLYFRFLFQRADLFYIDTSNTVGFGEG
jgi:hypothetical protein